MRRVVVTILDGLRRDLVRADFTPNLARFAERAESFPQHRSIAPSVTRAVSSSFATGCYPARHGLQGNALALREPDAFVVHDTGKPEFLQHRKRVTGRSLDRPTLSERLLDHGGAIVFSNVSPGAAYAHDPDGYGHVYHRAGSYGPQRAVVPTSEELAVTLDVAGERAMTERFVRDVLEERRPAYALMWLGEPDHIQHEVPLGSPEHLAVLRAADENAGRVIEAVDRLRDAGDDILLVVGSDHGHQTVKAVIDVEAELQSAGFAPAIAAGELVVVPNGTAVLIYGKPSANGLLTSLDGLLRTSQWAGEVFGPKQLSDIGQSAGQGLAFFVSMAADDERNAFDIPGRSYEARPVAGKANRLGCGQHGGLGRFEQSPFLMIDGPGFERGTARATPTSVVDIAPTLLTHLGLTAEGMDGTALQVLGRST
jgi:arylsulfatase A-like enzyme